MKSFCIKTTWLSTLMLLLVWLTLIQADGYADPFYLRFTTPKQSSLIVGTSRAAQGIIPSVIDSILGRNDLFNFSMTVSHSPFGPKYLKSISKKLNEETTDGIFIVSVSPWAISSVCKDPNDTLAFRENSLPFSTLSNVNQNPNFEYLLKSYSNPYYHLWHFGTSHMFLHDDGWLEVTVDSKFDNVRTQRKIEHYKKIVKKNHPSELRLSYLRKTIEKLNQHGQVYIVRLPICREMMDIENQYMPQFESQITDLESDLHTPYFNLTTLPFPVSFTDGNHLEKHSGRTVSAELADRIRAHKRK